MLCLGTPSEVTLQSLCTWCSFEGVPRRLPLVTTSSDEQLDGFGSTGHGLYSYFLRASLLGMVHGYGWCMGMHPSGSNSLTFEVSFVVWYV